MRTKCGHDRPSWHILGVPFIIRGWIWKKGTNVGTIVEVGTISAYLSLSEGGCGPKLSKVGTIGCGFGPNLNNVDTIAQVATISAYLSLFEDGFGKKRKDCGHDRRSWYYLGVPFPIRRWMWTKIEQSGHYRMWIWTNIEQSGHDRNQNRAKIEQSGHYRSQNRTKWALSGVEMVQGWIWTHDRRVKIVDFLILSKKSKGQVDNPQSRPERGDQS